MAFFDQVGKFVSDAGQSVAHSTKNLAAVAQLNSEISEKEKKISKLYIEIGQAYYEKHKKDPQAEGTEQINEISALLADIAQCKDKIKQIKGVTKCENCGAEVPIGAAFCNACGAKINSAETEDSSAEE